MRVKLSPEAAEEVREAARWYRQRSRQAAGRFRDQVRATLRLLSEFPEIGSPLDGIGDGDPFIRTRVVADFPYVAVYVIESNEILVLAVAHAKRQPGYWKDRL